MKSCLVTSRIQDFTLLILLITGTKCTNNGAYLITDEARSILYIARLKDNGVNLKNNGAYLLNNGGWLKLYGAYSMDDGVNLKDYVHLII